MDALSVTVVAADSDEATLLSQALAASQSITVNGSRIELIIANAEADRMVTGLLGEIEGILSDEGLDQVSLEMNGNTHIIRPR
jgi:hypothetical protein